MKLHNSLLSISMSFVRQFHSSSLTKHPYLCKPRATQSSIDAIYTSLLIVYLYSVTINTCSTS